MHHSRQKAQKKVGRITVHQEMTARQCAGRFSVVETRGAVVKRREEILKLYGVRRAIGREREGAATWEEKTIVLPQKHLFRVRHGKPARSGEHHVALDALVFWEQYGLLAADIEAARQVATRFQQRKNA